MLPHSSLKLSALQETDYYETLHNIIQSDKVPQIQWSYEEAWLHDILGKEPVFPIDFLGKYGTG